MLTAEPRGVEPRSLDFQSSAYTKSAKVPSQNQKVAAFLIRVQRYEGLMQSFCATKIIFNFSKKMQDYRYFLVILHFKKQLKDNQV